MKSPDISALGVSLALRRSARLASEWALGQGDQSRKEKMVLFQWQSNKGQAFWKDGQGGKTSARSHQL